AHELLTGDPERMKRRATYAWAALTAAIAIAAQGRGLGGELLGADRTLVDRSPLISTPAPSGAAPSLPAWSPRAVAALTLAAGRGEILGDGFVLLALLFLLRARDVDVGERPSALALGLAIACQSAASFASPLAILLSVALIVSLALEPAAERRRAPRALDAAILVGASVPARALALAA